MPPNRRPSSASLRAALVCPPSVTHTTTHAARAASASAAGRKQQSRVWLGVVARVWSRAGYACASLRLSSQQVSSTYSAYLSLHPYRVRHRESSSLGACAAPHRTNSRCAFEGPGEVMRAPSPRAHTTCTSCSSAQPPSSRIVVLHTHTAADSTDNTAEPAEGVVRDAIGSR